MPSPLSPGFAMTCPACGKGALFDGLLHIAEHCSACGQDLRAQDSGDGPAFFAITIVGFLVVGLAAWVELTWHPSIGVHMLIWTPFILLSSTYTLRLFKALLIAYQYHYKLDLGEKDRS